MDKYDNMSREELTAALDELKDTLEELNEEREMMLYGTTGLHRSVAHLVEKYKTEIGEVNEAIEYINNLLK